MRWTEQDVADHMARVTGKTVEEFVQDLPKVERKSKYNAERVWMDGIYFDSKKEAGYYGELRLRALTGDIAGFMYHGKIVCAEGFGSELKASVYEPDFVVFNNDKTCEIVDTKGVETDTFKLKIKCIKSRYPKLDIVKK